MEYNNKAKLREQNSSRLTDSKKGLAVTKEKGFRSVGGEGGRRGLRGITISSHNIGRPLGRQDCMRRHVITMASYHADSDCSGVRAWGLDNVGEC